MNELLLTKKSDLADIANAIKNKIGNNSPLVFPLDFINTINSLNANESGGNESSGTITFTHIVAIPKTFTGTTEETNIYEIESGMTWADFIGSEYDTYGLFIDYGEEVYYDFAFNEIGVYMDSDYSTIVKPSDLIISGYTYYSNGDI